jgi:hypothetical protein
MRLPARKLAFLKPEGPYSVYLPVQFVCKQVIGVKRIEPVERGLSLRVVASAHPRKERVFFIHRVLRGGHAKIAERGFERLALILAETCALRLLSHKDQYLKKSLYTAMAIAKQANRVFEIAFWSFAYLNCHRRVSSRTGCLAIL